MLKQEKEPEKLLTIDELLTETQTEPYKLVGALVAAGKQQELDIERKKHPKQREPFMTASEFKEHLKNYEE